MNDNLIAVRNRIIKLFYNNLLKRIYFKMTPEFVHERMTMGGQTLGSSVITKKLTSVLFTYSNKILEQDILNIHFRNPIGLSAGFDYEAKLTQVLPDIGFGFGTIGTITNQPYGGNPGPMLGRLPKSKSLMVNKGFKNEGADEVINKLSKLSFDIPIGISIGKTNTLDLKTQKQGIDDIITAFTKFEKGKIANSYYEINISCPNLKGNISFYPPQNLKELLGEVEKLHIKKPVFIKMPIEKSDKEILDMMKIIVNFNIKGVIFGNLQKNRKDPALFPDEVSKFKVGNFSGKPTYRRSNELIKLVYKHYRKKLIIIGCGGVFSPEDAYEKIRLGATLVQMITGMIFEGPQVISEINQGLVGFLKRDGFSNISEAIGADVKS